jgi:3-hydroxyacyl-CoA dehydrogenase
LKKVAVRSGICDGFIGNRIMNAYRKAAEYVVLDGASPYQVDKAVTTFGFPMGPFAMGDLAGLDINWAARKRRAPTRDPRERVPRFYEMLCEGGDFGQKTGKGFYVYEAGQRGGVPNSEVAELIARDQEQQGVTPREFSDAEVLRRYMCAMVNEAAKVVGEGIARRPLDVDMVMLFGYGFPRFWGGPLKWADLQGLDGILADIKAYAEEDSFFWQPAPLLEKLVAEGKTFDDLNKGA